MTEIFAGEVVQPARQERIDVLFALSMAFSAPGEVKDWFPPGSEEARLWEQRAGWHAALPSQEKTAWVKETLHRLRSSLREEGLRLDPHVHPSQVAAALRIEPLRIQRLVLRYLPRTLARSAASALGLDFRRIQTDEVGKEEPSPGRHPPVPQVISIVRQNFLSRFVSASALGCLTSFDLLSGAQLARLQHMLGIRETALAASAAKSRAKAEDFLRSFAPDDACLLLRQRAGLCAVSPARLALARNVLGSALRRGLAGCELLDEVGLRSMAMALAISTAERARYTAQKLPMETAQIFLTQVWQFREISDPQTSLTLLQEIEKIAQSLRTPATLSAHAR